MVHDALPDIEAEFKKVILAVVGKAATPPPPPQELDPDVIRHATARNAGFRSLVVGALLSAVAGVTSVLGSLAGINWFSRDGLVSVLSIVAAGAAHSVVTYFGHLKWEPWPTAVPSLVNEQRLVAPKSQLPGHHALRPGAQERLASTSFDPEAVLAGSLNTVAPWESVVDFVTSPSFCGFPLFPKQVTLLRLIFLETEQMTAFDLDTIEDWRKGFTRHREIYGVQPDIWQRVEYLKERGYRRFPHIQAVLGHRGAKGVLGGVLGTEQIAFLHSLDNPQAVYGIAEAKDVYLNVGATSQTVAMRQQFADVRTMIEQCKYFRPENKPTWIAESKDAILRV